MASFIIAVVDDDPVEHFLITEMTADLPMAIDVVCFHTLEAFLQAEPQRFSHVFLDRRLPPHSEYTDTLPQIAATEFSGEVILMTAHDPGLDTGEYGLTVTGPVDKLDLIKPEIFGAILEGHYLAA